jgi:NADPH2:quinone reductase
MSLQRVTRSTIIDAPIERVWEVLRDFNSHRHWHPIIDDSFIEGGEAADQVGCVRAFRLKDGNELREQLLALDDRNFALTYCILDSTIPLQRYVATVRLKRVTDGNRTFWHWQSTFATPPGRERELADAVGTGVYEAGFAALRDYLRRRPAARPAPAGVTQPIEGPAIVLAATGGPEHLHVASVRAAAPGPGEVRLRQSAIGVNYIDVYVRTGQYGGLVSPGGVPGFEAAGTVVDVGAGVTHLAAGDRVAYACMPAGAYAAVRTMAADAVVRLPDHVGEEVAAAVMLKGCTAELCLARLHRVQPGETVLVHAAAGGLGMLVAQWARALGCRVIGTVGTEEKARIARGYCDTVVVASGGRFAAAVLEATAGRGADLIVDGLGEPGREDNLESLAGGGHWIAVGQAGGPLQPVDPARLSRRSATLSRPVVFHYMTQAHCAREMAQRVFDALRDGRLRPQITRFGLTGAPQAHAALQSRQTTGQLILLA